MVKATTDGYRRLPLVPQELRERLMGEPGPSLEGPLEIGIDALPLLGKGGISRHLQDLLSELVARWPDHHYHLYARVFRRAQWRRYQEATRTCAGPHLSWHRIVLPDRLLEFAWTHHTLPLPGTGRCLKRLDVLLVTSGLAPAGAPCPLVGIVHDLVPLRFPHWFSADLPLIRARLTKLVARSRLLIAVSESTKQDLMEILGVPAERIRVVHHGIHPRFSPPPLPTTQTVLARRGTTGPFFLYVGGLGPVKNVGTLLEAFRTFRERTKASHELLLAGDLRWAGTLPRDVERLGLGGTVHFLGFVEDADLPALYAGATAVVLPSWYESFGFPALEAMACGAPVLAAEVGALPELLADAALFFPPDSPRQLSECLTRISTDQNLRVELSTRGRARAATFTWERAATATVAVLREATKGSGGRNPHV